MSSVRLREFATVRVRALVDDAAYDGWSVNRRPPAPGDVGAIVDVLRAPGLPDRYVVECSGPDGVDHWLADFAAEELELVAEEPAAS